MDLSQCFHLFDVKQITESSFYHPRKKHIRTSTEEIGIDEPPKVDSDELDDFFRTPAARYTNARIYAHVSELLREADEFSARDYPLLDDHDYLTAIHMALYSTDYRSPYIFEAGEESVTKGRYAVPNFTLRRKGDNA